MVNRLLKKLPDPMGRAVKFMCVLAQSQQLTADLC